MNKVSARAFCKDVAEIKTLAKTVLNSEDKFACVEAYLDICRMCEKLCKDCFGAEGISLLFSAERKEC